MRNFVLMAAVAATFTFTACNSCGGHSKQKIVMESEMESDSLFMLNDSTLADLQTFVFEGKMPMNNGTVADVILLVRALSLSDNGEYEINTSYMNGNTPTQWSDTGETVVFMGVPNDSTAIVYELISYSNNPQIMMKVNPDSSLTKLNSKMMPASNNPEHKLMHKK